MKDAQLFFLVVTVVAVASVTSVESSSRSLNAITLNFDFDPLDTYDAFKDDSGRTYLRVVGSPLPAENEEEGTVFGKIFEGFMEILSGLIEGASTAAEKAFEVRNKEGEETASEGGAKGEAK